MEPWIITVIVAMIAAELSYLIGLSRSFRDIKQDVYRRGLPALARITFHYVQSEPITKEEANAFNEAIASISIYGNKKVVIKMQDVVANIHKQKGDNTEAFQKLMEEMRKDVQILGIQYMKPKEFTQIRTSFVLKDELKEMNRKKHASLFKEKVIDPWVVGPTSGDFQIITGSSSLIRHPLGGVSLDDGKIRQSLNNKLNFDFFDAFLNHLSTGYPDIEKLWNQIIKDAGNLNKKCVEFIEKLKVKIKNETNLKEYGLEHGEPEKYFRIGQAMEAIYQALQYEKLIDEWLSKHEINPQGGNFVLKIEGYSAIAKSPDKQDLSDFVNLMISIAKDLSIKEKVSEIEKEKDILERQHHEFKDKLRELSKKIEMGGYLEGECEYCRNWKR